MRRGGHDRKGVIATAHPWEYHLIKQNDGNRIRHILPSHAMHYLCLSIGSICVSLASPLEKAKASHSSTLAWKIPWMEEPDGLPSMGSHRDGYD